MLVLNLKSPRNQIVYFDVDDTLIIWIENTHPDAEEAIVINDSAGSTLTLPIKENIEKLKAHFALGDTIVVWTQGGAEWAEAVVKAYGLESFVHLCLGKPELAYDDLAPNEWMLEKWVLAEGE